jgi:hypothetical protein
VFEDTRAEQGYHGPMAEPEDGGDVLHCSFCTKAQTQVRKLIAGPGVYICDDCVRLCADIIEQELGPPSPASPT